MHSNFRNWNVDQTWESESLGAFRTLQSSWKRGLTIRTIFYEKNNEKNRPFKPKVQKAWDKNPAGPFF